MLEKNNSIPLASRVTKDEDDGQAFKLKSSVLCLCIDVVLFLN